jgi:hypothetical protein
MTTATNRLWSAYAYFALVVLAICATVWAGFAVSVKPGDAPWWVIAIPFAVGLAFGATIPKHGRGNPAVLLAIFAGPLVMCVGDGIICMISAIKEPNPNVTAPLVVHGLAVAVMLFPGALLYGAVPGLIGAVITHFLKRDRTTAQSCPECHRRTPSPSP